MPESVRQLRLLTDLISLTSSFDLSFFLPYFDEVYLASSLSASSANMSRFDLCESLSAS